jgi:TolB-like protein/Flp pilus assembly protein TadD
VETAVDSERLWSELKRRKVLRAGVLYLIIAWTTVQVAETVWEPLEFPPHTLTLLIWVAAAGFPLTLVLAWIYDITRKGIVKDAGPEPLPEVPTTKPSPGLPSVAVLPFADMSEAHDQGYFCDGVAEEILNTLTRINGLHVASRTSSFQFRSQSVDIKDIGKQLKVSSVLEGSVRKSGNRLRVTAQLINAENGYHLWSERFDAPMEDVFTVQENIASCIAKTLELSLESEQVQVMQRSSTRDVQAYDYYLKAWSYFHRFDTRNMLYARQMFSRAIEIDPEFARAWGGLADAAAFLYMYSESREEYRQQADEASRKAVELCFSLAEAHASRGLALMLLTRFEQSEQEFEQAIALNRDSFEAHYFYARACVHQGKYEMAARLFERAALLDPDDCQSAAFMPQVLKELGRSEEERTWREEAIRRGTRRLELHPDDVRAMYLTGVLYAKEGDQQRALELADRAMALEPDASVVQYNLACLYAQCGNIEKALDCLEASSVPGLANKGWVQHDSDLDPLRDHPRFQAVLDNLT